MSQDDDFVMLPPSEATLPTLEVADDKEVPRDGTLKPVDPSIIPVVHSGNLHKHGRRFKRWHQRYFELQGPHLYYYKKKDKSVFLGEINLDSCYFVGMAKAETFGCPFELQTVERSHVLAAKTEDERREWIKFIKENQKAAREQSPEGQSLRGRQKPKRWQTFKQAFSKDKQRSSSSSTAVEKKQQQQQHKRGLFRRTKKVVSSASITSNSSSLAVSPSHHTKRPLSIASDEVFSPTPMDPSLALAAAEKDSFLLSSSLPGTPLTQRRGGRSPSPPPIISDLSANNVDTAAPSTKVSPPMPPPVDKLAYLDRRFAFDEIRDLLDSMPESTDANCVEPLVGSWSTESTAIDQLREFLVVCP